MTDEHIEEEVRRLVSEDDPRALELLYDIFGGSLYGFLAARLRDVGEAEDVLQELFLDLARRPSRLLGARKIGPWLFAKARNLSIDRMRARERLRGREKEWPVWLEPPASAGEPVNCDVTRIAGLLDRLPIDQKDVIVMKVLQGRTFAEVGELLGISINTAASRYRYALEKLREWLKGAKSHDF